jgi:MFS family permease
MQLTQKQWTLLLYSITFVFLFADQNLLSPNLSAAAKDFGFNDLERDKKLGGDIAIAFFLVGAPASFIVGCLADSHHIRRNILFGTIVLIGEGACMATYFTTTYSGLYVTRALTGFSVGGALPVLSSVLGDWFPPEEQSTVMGYVGLGTAVGIAFGQVISGMIGPAYGWRMPFLAIGLPAVIFGLVFMVTTVDPPRPRIDKTQDHNVGDLGSQEQASKEHFDYSHVHIGSCQISSRSQVGFDGSNHSVPAPTSLNKEPLSPATYLFGTIFLLLKTPSVLIALFQGIPGCFTWGMINTYLNDYLSSDIGMTVHEATFTVMIFVIGVFLGILGGAYGGKKLYLIDVRYPSLLAGGMAVTGSVPLWMLINATPVNRSDGSTMSTWEYVGISFAAFLSGTCSGFIGPIIKAILQNVIGSDARGQAFAMFNTFDDFGRGLGPYFVAQLISSMGNRRQAFNVAVVGWIFSGLLVLCTFFTIKRDQDKLTPCSSDVKASEQLTMPEDSDNHPLC